MKQTWPKMWLKVGRFAIITNWKDRLPFLDVKYKTSQNRETFYSTHVIVHHIFGPLYRLKEYHMEVIKTHRDVTHPSNKGKTFEEIKGES